MTCLGRIINLKHATDKGDLVCKTSVLLGDELAKYGFGSSHPLNNNRMEAFWNKFMELVADRSLIEIEEPTAANEETILSFHDKSYVNLVKQYLNLVPGI